tara:strand:- start:649 stop:1437 length:789 start_codon:yes stop_codon:yes gene_type:complete
MASFEDEYYISITKYYELKQKYDNQVKSIKKKYLSNNYSIMQNKQILSKLNYKCINCNKDGGCIFSNQNNILKAVCGNKTNPCKLNIIIKKGNVDNVIDMLDLLTSKLLKLKSNIIMLKLDYIFNYKNEENSSKEFETINSDITKTYEEYNLILDKYINITNNKDKIDEIRLKQLELYELIDKIKYCNKQYIESNKIIFVKEAIDIYINKLVSLVETIKQLKYKNVFVDNNKDTNEKTLYKYNLLIENFEIFKDYRVEKFDL